MKRLTILLLWLLTAVAAPARTVYSVDEGWRFFFRHENSSDNARIVTLPHTWNTPATEGNRPYLQTTGIYQNLFYAPDTWQGKRLFLKFYGVQNVANVFVNGYHVGEHRGGATAFTFEITERIRCGAENTLRIDVSNTWQNDVLPASSDMNLYGGIYRNVELIVTGPTAISPLYYGSDGVLIHPGSVTADRVEGEAEIHLLSASGGGNCTLTLEITAPDGYQSFIRSQKARLDGKPVHIPFSFEKPALWSPRSPELYSVTATVEHNGVRDTVCVRTGFRAIDITADAGFRVNGERIAVKGVSLYHDNAVAGGALTAADYDTDLQFVREIGANAVRSAGMPHAPYFYDLCDREGLLAWVDLPFQRAPFLGDVAYFATQRFEENGRQQLREMIIQLMNHPSVAMWGIFSCLWARGDDALPYIRSLNELAHALDPSRPTVACSDQDGALNFVTDLIVWQQNVGWERGSVEDVKVWSELLRKNWRHLRSAVCYGAEGLPGHRTSEIQAAPRTNWLPESRQTRFHEGYAKHLDSDSLFWGIWINNLFDFSSARRPYGVNASGLVGFDRRTRKDAFYLYKTLWNPDATTPHLTGKRLRQRADGHQQFTIYSRMRPTLRIGMDTVHLRTAAPCRYLSDSVVLNGVCRVEATAGGYSDSVELTVGNVLKRKQPKDLPQRANLPQTN